MEVGFVVCIAMENVMEDQYNKIKNEYVSKDSIEMTYVMESLLKLIVIGTQLRNVITKKVFVTTINSKTKKL